MTGFLRTAATTAAAITLVGGALVVALPGPEAPSASSSASAQVEDEAAGTVDGGLLEAPVQTGPGTAVALLDSLTASYASTGFPETQRVVLTRDPFRPVVPVPAVDGGGTTDPTDPSGPGDPGDPTDPVDPTDPTGPGGPSDSDGCSGDEEETVCDGRVVTLDGFDDAGAAIVTVDGVQYTVTVGDEFATSFRVLANNAPCATLLYGDESFSICTGVTVLK